MNSRFKKHRHPPFFSKNEKFHCNSVYNHVSRFLKNVRMFEKKVSVLMLLPGLYGGLYGQNLPYKFKNSYGDFQNRKFEKSHILVNRTISSGPQSDKISRIWETDFFDGWRLGWRSGALKEKQKHSRLFFRGAPRGVFCTFSDGGRVWWSYGLSHIGLPVTNCNFWIFPTRDGLTI
jgi:hypothetical protein